MDHTPTPRPFYRSLYFQVITAIVIGVILGHFAPATGEAMKPLGDGFIKLIKMIIAPSSSAPWWSASPAWRT